MDTDIRLVKTLSAKSRPHDLLCDLKKTLENDLINKDPFVQRLVSLLVMTNNKDVVIDEALALIASLRKENEALKTQIEGFKSDVKNEKDGMGITDDLTFEEWFKILETTLRESGFVGYLDKCEFEADYRQCLTPEYSAALRIKRDSQR